MGFYINYVQIISIGKLKKKKLSPTGHNKEKNVFYVIREPLVNYSRSDLF